MEADWTVACGADDPVVVVPWASEDGSVRYVDLRIAPSAIDEISEAAKYPCLAAALRRWNQPEAPISTAKCDVWNYAADLFDAEDLPGFAHAHGSYIDLIPMEPEILSSFANCEKLLRAYTETARRIEVAQGRCEWTLRPARIFPATTAASVSAGDTYTRGFAITLYVWGYGASPVAAKSAWSAALEALIEPVVLTMASQISTDIE